MIIVTICFHYGDVARETSGRIRPWRGIRLRFRSRAAQGVDLELLDEKLGAFRTEMMTMVGARTLTFREFRAFRAPNYHEAKDPIASNRWLADVLNAFRMSRCPEGYNVRLA